MQTLNYDHHDLQCYIIKDNAANHIYDGCTDIFCVSPDKHKTGLRNGHYVVLEHDFEGAAQGRHVRQVNVDGSKAMLCPVTDEKAHSVEFEIEWPYSGGRADCLNTTGTLAITGIVVQSNKTITLL